MVEKLSREQWIAILTDSVICHPEDLLLLQKIYSFPGHKAYASQIAPLLGHGGKKPHSALNLQIGRLAKRIARKYEVGLPLRGSQKVEYWPLFFCGWREKRYFVWQLRPLLIEAMRVTRS